MYIKSLGYFCSLNQCGTYIKGKSVKASSLFSRPYLSTAHKYLSSTSFFAVKIFSGFGVLKLVRLMLEKLCLYSKHVIPRKWLSLEYHKKSFCMCVIGRFYFVGVFCWPLGGCAFLFFFFVLSSNVRNPLHTTEWLCFSSPVKKWILQYRGTHVSGELWIVSVNWKLGFLVQNSYELKYIPYCYFLLCKVVSGLKD